jgi:hypothetical protein
MRVLKLNHSALQVRKERKISSNILFNDLLMSFRR